MSLCDYICTDPIDAARWLLLSMRTSTEGFREPDDARRMTYVPWQLGPLPVAAFRTMRFYKRRNIFSSLSGRTRDKNGGCAPGHGPDLGGNR